MVPSPWRQFGEAKFKSWLLKELDQEPQIECAQIELDFLRSCPPIHRARDGRSRLAHSTQPVGRVDKLSQISLHRGTIELHYCLPMAYHSCFESPGSVRPSNS
jgi:hypothetical protein